MTITEQKSVRGFHSIWLKLKDSCTEKHQIFYKEHSLKKQEREYPRGRTLFVLNIPPYVTPKSLKSAFIRNCGNVANIKFLSHSGEAKSGFQNAYIIFTKESSLEKALSLPNDFTIVLNTEENPCILGLKKWCKEYNAEARKNEKDLKEAIEKYMEEYDKKIEEQSAVEEEEMETDGWVTVSSKKKRGKFAPSRKESTIEKLQALGEEKKKKTQLVNFYAFQIRESKKQHLAELRKKFELDKKKLEQLKAKRTFKPFV